MSNLVLINGATSGIGVATAKQLLADGDQVILVSRCMSKLESTAMSLGLPIQNCYEFDNNDMSKLNTLFENIVSEHGKLSGLVCVAGEHKLKPLKISKELDFHDSYHRNFVCNMLFSKCFSKKKHRQELASIVFISSVAAHLGEACLSGYSASKGALISASRSLAVELAPSNIRVNCISPGWVDTEHAEIVKAQLGSEKVAKLHDSYPLGFGKPADVAFLINFLLSQRSSWITGQNITIDGGRSLI